MRRILPIVILLAWGLWLGGMIVLFIAVSSLFTTFANQHDLAGIAASRIFRIFNFYQLSLAAIALLAGYFYRPSPSPRNKPAFLGLLAVAMGAALVITFRLTPLIEQMRAAVKTSSPAFAKLHGISMAMYLMETLFVFLAGLLLPGMLERKS